MDRRWLALRSAGSVGSQARMASAWTNSWPEKGPGSSGVTAAMRGTPARSSPPTGRAATASRCCVGKRGTNGIARGTFRDRRPVRAHRRRLPETAIRDRRARGSTCSCGRGDCHIRTPRPVSTAGTTGRQGNGATSTTTCAATTERIITALRWCVRAATTNGPPARHRRRPVRVAGGSAREGVAAWLTTARTRGAGR